MPLEVVPVAYGRPAHDELARRVERAKKGDRLRPVTVVVPSNYVGVAARRRLAEQRGIIGVSFLTVYRLAELLGSAALAGDGRRPLSNPVLLVAVQEELARAPGVFAPVRDHPATEEALVAAHKLLADLPGAALSALATASSQAGEVVRLHRRVRERLGGWFDEADLLDRATSELRAGHPVGSSLGVVFVLLPQELSRRGAALLAEVARQREVVVLPGLTGSPDADHAVLRSVAWLGATTPSVAESPPATSDAAGLRVVTASDADDEARAAVRVVVAAARAGTPLERIAILHPGDEHSAALVEHHVQAAELPSNGATSERVADRVAGRVLLALLALAGAPAPHRADVFAILAGAPLRSAGSGVVPSVAWERLSREAGIIGLSRADWDARLTHLAAEKQRDADVQHADDRAGLARRLQHDAEQALALRDFVLDLLDRLADLKGRRTWATLAQGAADLLVEHLGAERQRARWPAAEREAASKVEAALDRLAHLDPVAPSPDLRRFERTLALELETDLGRRGRFGEGVLVGRVGLALGLDLDLVVVVGMAEGVLPTRQRDDALLPDRDRLVAGDDMPVAADRQRREHRELLAAVAAAQHIVVLTMPRGDLRRTTEHVASRWLTELVWDRHEVRLFSDELLRHDATWITHVPSFVAGLRGAPWPATEQEARLGMVLAGRRLAGDAALERATTLLAARAADALTAFDGHLIGVIVPSPVDATQVMSPTRLETWASCPYLYFVRHLLDVEPVDDPEELLNLPALDQGTLVHRTLEGYVNELITRAATDIQPDLALLGRHFELACQAAEARGVTGRSVLWRHQRDELWRHLCEFVTLDAARRAAERSMPLATELRFGFADAPTPAIEVDVGAGRTLRFRGSIDRVDRAGDGHLVVTDYKYSSTFKYRDLRPENPTANGGLLQLPIYALAAQAAFDEGRLPLPVTARYAFAKPDSSKGTIPKAATLEVDADLVERWAGTLAVIADGIEAGVFAARPGDDMRYAGFIGCRACDPDGLGTADVARRWARKHTAPALAGYLTMLGLATAEADEEAAGDD
jgi:RecB family exonuclease